MGANSRPVLYPRQKVVMLEDEVADRIETEAAGDGTPASIQPQSAVIRGYIKAGMAAVDAERALEGLRR